MATVTFTKETIGATIDRDGKQFSVTERPKSITERHGKIKIKFADNTEGQYNPSSDSIVVNAVDVTSTGAVAICNTLRDSVFNFAASEGTMTWGNIAGTLSNQSDLNTALAARATLTTAQTLTNKTLTAPVINSPTGIVKGDVGLSNVDNTSDATKNAATATLTNKTLTSPVINTPTGIVKGDVGLDNVDNTSDTTKNAATATLTNKTISGADNTISNVAQSSVTNLVSDLAGKAAVDSHSTLTYAATTDVDFTNAASLRTVSLTGDVTFTTSNKAAARSKTIRIISDGSTRAFTFPAWVFVGGAAPTDIAASKTAILKLVCYGTADTDIVATYSVQS